MDGCQPLLTAPLMAAVICTSNEGSGNGSVASPGIRRLRMKLGPARHHVETVVGLGYRFVKEPRPADAAHSA